LERPVFIASVVLNAGLIAMAIFIAWDAGPWLKAHHFLERYADAIRAGAVAAILAVPALFFIRNDRLAFIRGNSIRLSEDQFPQVYDILETHCRKLGMSRTPELYLTDRAISMPARAFSAWGGEYIALRTDFLETPLENVRDVLAFTLGYELGRLRLGHDTWWSNALLSFVDKVPLLRTPVSKVRTYSRDRYGAFLAPEGLRGLLVLASGRRMLQSVNIDDYLKQVSGHGGFWARLADVRQPTPHVSYRIKALWAAGLCRTEHDLHRAAANTG
jgi:hypothetical protein